MTNDINYHHFLCFLSVLLRPGSIRLKDLRRKKIDEVHVMPRRKLDEILAFKKHNSANLKFILKLN